LEAGTSTYQIGKRRSQERATVSHNTVVVDGRNQSEVWGGFRVGDRANVKILKDTESNIVASHDGYKNQDIVHIRSFSFENNLITIFDEAKGSNHLNKEFHLHLAPDLNFEIDENNITIGNDIVIAFDKTALVHKASYELAAGYNVYRHATKIIVTFVESLHTRITFN